MSILKLAAVSEAPRDRIMGMLMYQMAPSKTENGKFTGGMPSLQSAALRKCTSFSGRTEKLTEGNSSRL